MRTVLHFILLLGQSQKQSLGARHPETYKPRHRLLASRDNVA